MFTNDRFQVFKILLLRICKRCILLRFDAFLQFRNLNDDDDDDDDAEFVNENTLYVDNKL